MNSSNRSARARKLGLDPLADQIQQNLDQLFSLGVRVLADHNLAEKAVLLALREAEQQEADTPLPSEAVYEDAVKSVARACLQLASENPDRMSPRHPNRDEVNDYSSLLISGISALPVEGRVILELYDRQQIETDAIADLIGIDSARVRQMLHSCRVFLLEYFQLAQRSGGSGSRYK